MFMMLIMEISNIKKELFQKREALTPAFVKDKSIQMMEDIINDKKYHEAKVIYLYLPIHKEIDTEYLLVQALQDGKKVAAPVVLTSGDMFFEAIDGNPGFHKGRYEFLQPNVDPKLIVDEPGLMIVPLLGFHGKRMIGNGKQYYNNYLLHRKENTYTIGIGYQFQEIKEEIPFDENDIELNEIRTY